MREQRTYEALVKERDEIKKLWMTMKIALKFDAKREELIWTRLLRERQSNCAFGYDTSCDYFNSQWNDEDEISVEGYPRHLTEEVKALKHTNPVAAVERLNRLEGVPRIKASLCTVENLLADDDSRIFETLGEYLEYLGMISPTSSFDGVESMTFKLASVFYFRKAL